MESSLQKRPDRRQRKTRAALQRALLDLVAAKPFDEITVDEVAESADVARATFYAHYENKTALLAEAAATLTEGLRAEVVTAGTAELPVYRGLGLALFLRYAEANHAMFKLIVSGGAGEVVRGELVKTVEDIVRAVFKQWARTPRLRLTFVVATFTGAVLRATEVWLADPRRPPAEAVAADLMQAQVGGLEWALGLEAGEIRYEPLRPGE